MTTSGTDQPPRGEASNGRPQARRRLDSAFNSPTSTIVITDAQFNANGSPSRATGAGVTSITVTSTGGGEVRCELSAVPDRVDWSINLI